MNTTLRTLWLVLGPGCLLSGLGGCRNADAPPPPPAPAAAAAAVPTPPETDDVPTLVRQLGSGNHRERETAQQELQRRWRAALPLLREAAQADDPEIRMRAREILDRVRSRENPRRYIQEAHALLARGQYDAALDKLAVALDLDAENPDLYVQRAAIRARQKDLPKAVEDLTRAIERAPTRTDLLLHRAGLWEALREYDKAITDYTAAIRQSPEDAELYCDRGQIWAEKHEYDKALADYAKATEIAPEAPGPFVLRGWLWAEQEQYDKTIAEATQAIELDSTFTPAYLTRADARAMSGDYAGALEDYDQAARDSREDIAANSSLAFTLFMVQRYDDARETYAKCLQRTGDTPGIWNNLAWVQATCPFDELRDGKVAVSNALLACEATKWNRADFTDTLAAAYAEIGSFTNAVKHQEQAIKLLPAPRKDFLFRLDLFRRGIPYREGQTNDLPPRVQSPPVAPAP